MKWTVAQLQKNQRNEFIIDETVNMERIKERDPTIREVSPMHISGRAEIDAKKVVFYLHIKGHFILPCSRTLVDVHYPIDVKTTEIFLLEDMPYESEEEIHVINGGVIDLFPIIEEILILEVPMQVFSEGETTEKGAPQEGKGWKVITEEEKKNQIDPRLAKLAQLFDEGKDSSSRS